jgi:hypothetical protein
MLRGTSLSSSLWYRPSSSSRLQYNIAPRQARQV